MPDDVKTEGHTFGLSPRRITGLAQRRELWRPVATTSGAVNADELF